MKQSQNQGNNYNSHSQLLANAVSNQNDTNVNPTAKPMPRLRQTIQSVQVPERKCTQTEAFEIRPQLGTTNLRMSQFSAQTPNQRTNINAHYAPAPLMGKSMFKCNCPECKNNQPTRLEKEAIMKEPIFPTKCAVYGKYHYLPVITARIGNWEGKFLLDSRATRSILSAAITDQIGAPLRENADYTTSGINGQINMRHQVRTTV